MPETDLALLTEAARAAGDIALRYFKSDPQVWDKADGAGPVTEADLAVNAHLAKTLQTARPDYGWLSEETEDTSARLQTKRQFVIDPIDGTRAFIEGSGNWAHSIAVVENGQPVAGVVYLPAKDVLFAAEHGRGATLNGTAISVAPTSTLDGATVLSNKPSFADKQWIQNAPPKGLTRHFRSSLAYRLCLVAQGRFDAMMTLRPTWEWDIAAGVLIVQEAGGTATDPSGLPLTFNNNHPQVPGVVAGGEIAPQICKSLNPNRP